MVQKNEEYIVDIVDNGIDGEGIAKIDGYTIFISGAIKGEKIRTLIVKANKTFGFGKILEIIEKSPERVEPDCHAYSKCGGCTLQHMSYEAQLRFKEEKVRKTLAKFLDSGTSIKSPIIATDYVEEDKQEHPFSFQQESSQEMRNKEERSGLFHIIGMGIPYNYRNKAQYPCQNGKIGFYSPRTHSLVENDNCLIQDEDADKLAKYAFKVLIELGNDCYNEETKAGTLRHIMTRVGKNSGEQMLVIITSSKELKNKEEFVKEMTSKFPELKSIVQNINDKDTNIIMGEKCITLYGEEYIVDTLGDYDFMISPLSFYQVNPVQTEALYNTAIEMAELNGDETAFDLYCGIGTIATFLSSKCKKVYGVEVVPEAIEDAKKNATLNNITNLEFRCGAAEEVIPKMYEKENINADVVFVDPPRKGCDQVLLDTIIKMRPEKLVYVSCNVATLGRDLKYLTDNGFELKKVQPVDQFPQTAHVETIVILKLK